ncbi:LacI family transcriptional regulator [Leifsonia sp. ku-ls]|nr:LacI family transcriptional regulator [Leifsonia sp. ku-ls]
MNSSNPTARPRVTIADIAKQAGVSPGAVSFALNGRPGVSEATRERILAVARANNWQPNTAARALVGARAGVVGLAINRPARTLGSEAFFADLISGVQAGLAPTRTATHLRIAAGLDDELQIYREWSSSQQVDGVVVIDPRDDDPRFPLLAELGLPAIVLGSHPAGPDSPAAVWIDDTATADTLFAYLAALGHDRIAYVSGPAEFEHTALRCAALQRVAGDAGTWTATGYAPAAAAAATRTLLSSERPTAIVYDNDVMAVAGLRVAQEMGVAVPADVSIASFDDSVMASLVHPSLTAMTRDTFELGALAASTLLAQLDAGAEPVPSIPGPTPALTVRESTAPPAR